MGGLRNNDLGLRFFAIFWKFDGLKGIGTYSEIKVDTLLNPYPIPGPARTEYETRYLEPGKVGPEPIAAGKVELDTTKWFGPKGERFGVRVYGAFHWPQQFAYMNRLPIDPLGFEKTPQGPPIKRSRYSWGIGPTVALKSNDALFTGFIIHARRISLYGLKDFRKTNWIFGLEYRLF